ncbi:DUF5798 family protein [Halapricum desulfuricans]|uniref:Uncharacterized protein n=1 Tax=Halapricum desulfuricans TaxID=2841257 RepID=A0A897N8V8_9EURY|nr:DUF5798 family protein [Halapricum desulfuricans]QSG07583.1 Uncharacterized protein HSR122_0166 [Halapricum desulfuricans]QSG13269.1 Uncharacterized protein HSBGL_2875 [Halapricum desulfuricans]
MGFGDTAKKLQKVSSIAEDSYKRMNELREQLAQLRKEVESTSEQVDQMEYDLAEQRALLEALVEQQGLDVETIVAEANIEDLDAGDGGENTAEVEDEQSTEEPSDGDARA